MKCGKCGQEHERLYLCCVKHPRAGVEIYREHGRIIAECRTCHDELAAWPAKPAGANWDEEKKQVQ